jgi:hypothetical protein
MSKKQSIVTACGKTPVIEKTVTYNLHEKQQAVMLLE